MAHLTEKKTLLMLLDVVSVIGTMLRVRINQLSSIPVIILSCVMMSSVLCSCLDVIQINSWSWVLEHWLKCVWQRFCLGLFTLIVIRGHCGVAPAWKSQNDLCPLLIVEVEWHGGMRECPVPKSTQVWSPLDCRLNLQQLQGDWSDSVLLLDDVEGLISSG